MHTEQSLTIHPIETIGSYKDFIAQFNVQYYEYAEWKRLQLTGFNDVGDLLATSFKKTFFTEAKRVRPLMAYLTHRLVNTTYYPSEIIRLGFGLELFHNFALIHDDITDLSLMRRGEPTIEAEFIHANRDKGNEIAKHIGLNAAMYAGDIALFQSTYIINTLTIPLATQATIRDLFYVMQTEVSLGQVDDGFGVRHDRWDQISEDRIRHILSLKSGRYTIQKPMMLGAALAEVNSELLADIEKEGEEFGIVFQIKDDLLGLYGNEEIMGKSASSDIIEGKKTLLMYHTYQRASAIEKELIDRTLGNHNALPEDIDKLKKLVETTGVRAEMEEVCDEGAKRFCRWLRSIPNTNPEILEIFCDLATYIVTRDK